MEIKRDAIIKGLEKQGYKQSKTFPEAWESKKLKAMVVPKTANTEPTFLKDTNKPPTSKVILPKKR